MSEELLRAHKNVNLLFLKLLLGGTIFLDEIENLELPIQAKFLTVLEEKKIRRIGGRAEIEAVARYPIILEFNLPISFSAKRIRIKNDRRVVNYSG